MRDVGARPGVRVDRGRRGDGSGSARQDQSYKAGNNKAAGKRGFDSTFVTEESK
jgi:hypothetical protein